MALEKPTHLIFRRTERKISYVNRRHSNSHSATRRSAGLPERTRRLRPQVQHAGQVRATCIGKRHGCPDQGLRLGRAQINLSWVKGEKP
jgi:hypothetical protein